VPETTEIDIFSRSLQELKHARITTSTLSDNWLSLLDGGLISTRTNNIPSPFANQHRSASTLSQCVDVEAHKSIMFNDINPVIKVLCSP
jgi:hypothetical protein